MRHNVDKSAGLGSPDLFVSSSDTTEQTSANAAACGFSLEFRHDTLRNIPEHHRKIISNIVTMCIYPASAIVKYWFAKQLAIRLPPLLSCDGVFTNPHQFDLKSAGMCHLISSKPFGGVSHSPLCHGQQDRCGNYNGC